nr:hypothetical protein [Tanacetum cinerariifolium]
SFTSCAAGGSARLAAGPRWASAPLSRPTPGYGAGYCAGGQHRAGPSAAATSANAGWT